METKSAAAENRVPATAQGVTMDRTEQEMSTERLDAAAQSHPVPAAEDRLASAITALSDIAGVLKDTVVGLQAVSVQFAAALAQASSPRKARRPAATARTRAPKRPKRGEGTRG